MVEATAVAVATVVARVAMAVEAMAPKVRLLVATVKVAIRRRPQMMNICTDDVLTGGYGGQGGFQQGGGYGGGYGGNQGGYSSGGYGGAPQY